MSINYQRFYFNGKSILNPGHLIDDLEKLYNKFQDKKIIYLAGDSSLDNKHWLGTSRVNAVNGYETILNPPQSIPDVAYQINKICFDNKLQHVCINTSVEATALRDRDSNLLDEDRFIRDHIREQDGLIVSVGGNDIALKPTEDTRKYLQNILTNSNTDQALIYFENLFKSKIKNYIEKLISKKKPKFIIICMIYYPCEHGTSWAQSTLDSFNYKYGSADNEKLRSFIRTLYKLIQKIKIDNTNIIYCPLYEVLDPLKLEHFEHRVEPSIEGGRLMARRFINDMKLFYITNLINEIVIESNLININNKNKDTYDKKVKEVKLYLS